MEQFQRGERLYQVKRLKQKRKQYWGATIVKSKALGKVAQYPCICSCTMCSPTSYKKQLGNSVHGLKTTEQSVLQLLRTEESQKWFVKN